MTSHSHPPLRKIQEPQQILDELVKSMTQKNVVGIFFKGETELVTTAVVNLIQTDIDTLVQFKDTDLHGYELDKNPVLLSDIDSVIHFETLFDEPVYANIRQRRAHVRKIVAA